MTNTLSLPELQNVRGLTRFLLFFCLVSSAAIGQIHPHFGIQVGVPLTDTLSSSYFSSSNAGGTSTDRYNSKTKRLLVGPAFRVELVRGLGLEFDALYQRVDYDHFTLNSSGSLLNQSFEQGRGDRWQFPLLVQYAFKLAGTTPFIEAGPTISRITNVSGQVSAKTMYANTPSSNSSSTYQSVGTSATRAGFTAGGGVDFPLGHVHLRPEFRYAHWFAASNSSTGIFAAALFPVAVPVAVPANFRTNQNEASFLLGISF